MITFSLEVGLIGGLHVLNAVRLRSLSTATQSLIFLKKEGRSANVLDPISVLRLRIRENDSVTVMVDGVDEEETARRVRLFLEGNWADRKQNIKNRH